MNHEQRRTRLLTGATYWFACVAAAMLAGEARAESRREAGQAGAPALPRAMLLATNGPAATALPMNTVIHAALEELHVVAIVAEPGLDLAAVQLALDCVAQTAHCLKAVAARERAQVLIAPSLQSLPDGLVLSVLRFDTRQGELRSVVRRQRGRSVGPALLDAVPNMLRELFDLPQQASPAETKRESPPSASEAFELKSTPTGLRDARGLPVGPLVLAGVGASSLAAALGVGVALKRSEADYDRVRSSVDTKQDAQAAVDARARGRTEAALANVLFSVGGGALVGAVIWFALELNRGASTDSATASIRPIIAPSQLGVVFTKRGAWL